MQQVEAQGLLQLMPQEPSVELALLEGQEQVGEPSRSLVQLALLARQQKVVSVLLALQVEHQEQQELLAQPAQLVEHLAEQQHAQHELMMQELWGQPVQVEQQVLQVQTCEPQVNLARNHQSIH